MTICIASITSEGDLIAISDHMLSVQDGTFTAEASALKDVDFSADWFALYSSDDVGVVPGLLRRVFDSIRDWNAETKVDDMTRIVRRAFQDERLARAEELYLLPNSLTLQSLYLPETVIARGDNAIAILKDRVEQHQLATDLLVCGYDGQPSSKARRAHVLHVTDPGVVKNYEVPGYWAIGKGSFLALSWLAARRHSRFTPLPKSVYQLCEAKFCAEGASDVGEHTFVVVHKSDRSWKSMDTNDPMMATIRTAWETSGRPPVPKEPLIEVLKWCRAADGWEHDEGDVDKATPSTSQTADSSSPVVEESAPRDEKSSVD